jgi:hypothetical protein
MPGLRILRHAGRLPAWKTVLRGLWLAALVAGLVGCARGRPQLTRVTPPKVELPSPKLNPDLTKTLRPSHDRDWTPNQAVLPYAELHGDQVTLHNVRSTTYRTATDYDVARYDKTLDLSELDRVDFVVIPFNDIPGVAHTMLSFGFGGRDYVGVSVEIRKEQGEAYDPIKGFFRQYELIYVVADERDLIQRNTIHYLCDVHVYRTRATPEQARALFLDVMDRVNKLHREPEFYHTLTNNCTTNIRNHVNRVFPNRVPYDYRVLLPAYSDRLAYELGLLEADTSFERTRDRARVTYQAYLYRDDPEFSVKIRR